MEDQSQLTLDRLFESVLHVCRMSHMPESLFGPLSLEILIMFLVIKQFELCNWKIEVI